MPNRDAMRFDDIEIRASIDGFVGSIRARLLDGVMAVFAPDVVSFDLGPPLRHGGGAEFRERWQTLFDAHEGAIEYEVHDLHVTGDGDVAFSRSLNHFVAARKDGARTDRWLRWTACWRHADGAWRIVHEHVSVPVDAASGEAVFDAKP